MNFKFIIVMRNIFILLYCRVLTILDVRLKFSRFIKYITRTFSECETYKVGILMIGILG